MKTAGDSLQRPEARIPPWRDRAEVGPTKISKKFYGGSPSGKVKIASGNLQGNLPIQAVLVIVKFRGRGTWHGFDIISETSYNGVDFGTKVS